MRHLQVDMDTRADETTVKACSQWLRSKSQWLPKNGPSVVHEANTRPSNCQAKDETGATTPAVGQDSSHTLRSSKPGEQLPGSAQLGASSHAHTAYSRRAWHVLLLAAVRTHGSGRCWKNTAHSCVASYAPTAAKPAASDYSILLHTTAYSRGASSTHSCTSTM